MVSRMKEGRAIVPLYHTHCIIHRTQHRRRGDGIKLLRLDLHGFSALLVWVEGREGRAGEQWVLHHRHAFVSCIGDGDGVDSLGPWWKGEGNVNAYQWMDRWRSATYANHLAFIHSQIHSP
jgi:hypothetical protein